MDRYIALLRGINISGKNRIPMAELKKGLEEMGFGNVKTLLSSGNAAFNADSVTAESISGMIKDRFGLDIPVYVTKQERLAALIEPAPVWWGTDDKSIYDNLIFVLDGSDAEAIAQKIGPPSDGTEWVQQQGNSFFWSFVLGKHQKANWWKKTAEPGIGEYLTIRTAGTCRKLILL